jgi:D-xylose transport system ATP-binding protein
MEVTTRPESAGAAPNPAGTGASASPSGSEPLLKLRGVSKHFGAVQALYKVDLDLPAGQVTALCGDNGAGKSVLTKCIAGIHQPDEGQMYWEGRLVHIRTARDAANLGIETVYQDLALANNLDIVQNMFLGRERKRRLTFLDEDSMERSASQTLSSLRVTTVRSIRQLVATLGVAQTRMVLELVRTLRDRGLAVMVISHNLNDVFEVADRIAVLHLGRMVAQDWISAFDRQSVVDYMTTGRSGREVSSSGSPARRH